MARPGRGVRRRAPARAATVADGRFLLRVVLAVVAATVLGPATAARALVKEGDRLGEFVLLDPDEKPLRFSAMAGRPVLIIYEDKDTSSQNRNFKQRLNRMARSGAMPAKFAVLPVADVHKFDFWPARQMARDQLKLRSRELGHVLFADWSGEAFKRIGVPGGSSVLVLVDAEGKVVFAAAGALENDRQVRLMQLIKQQKARADVGPDPSDRPLPAPPPAAPRTPPIPAGESPAAGEKPAGPTGTAPADKSHPAPAPDPGPAPSPAPAS